MAAVSRKLSSYTLFAGPLPRRLGFLAPGVGSTLNQSLRLAGISSAASSRGAPSTSKRAAGLVPAVLAARFDRDVLLLPSLRTAGVNPAARAGDGCFTQFAMLT